MLNESCSIATLDGDDILYIARASSSRIMTIDRYRQSPSGVGDLDGPGAAEPSAGGEAQRYAGPGDHDPLYPTDGGFGGEAARRTETGASAGYALNDQELEMGLRSLAVPLFNAQGQVQAALNVGVHAGQMTAREMIERVLPELQKAARELTLLLR